MEGLTPEVAAALFDQSLDGVLLTAPDGRILDANRAAQRLLLLPTEELREIGRQGLTDTTDGRWVPALEERRRTGKVLAQVRMRRGDGSVFEAEISSAIFTIPSGEERTCVIFRDVSQRAALEAALREAEERFRTAFEHAPIGMAIVSTDGRWLQVNRCLCDITGYDADELVGMRFQEITHPDDLDDDLLQAKALLDGRINSYQMEKRYLRRDGSVVWVMLSGSVVRDHEGAPLHFVAQIENIDERKRHEARLEYEAHHDPLTGLLNRRPFEDLLRECAERGQGSLLLIDVDSMKIINDRHGHDAGDAVLQGVATSIARVTRQGDVAARIGGDEFALVLPTATLDDAAGVVQRLRAGLDLPAELSWVTISAGIASCADERPYEAADALLYQDKGRRAGRPPSSEASG